jgi:hypothetical protein
MAEESTPGVSRQRNWDQLAMSVGTCWTAEFTPAETNKNDGTLFKAKEP